MSIKSNFEVQSSTKGYQGKLTLISEHELQQPYRFVCFSLVRPLNPEMLVGAELISREGDFHKLQLSNPWRGESPLVIEFGGDGEIKKITDYPQGVFLQDSHGCTDTSMQQQPVRMFDQSPIQQDLKAQFIPNAQVNYGGEIIQFPSSFYFEGDQWALPWMERMLGNIVHSSDGWRVTAQIDPSLQDEVYLRINREGVQLTSKTETGFFVGQCYVMQYLIQLQFGQQLKEIELSSGAGLPYRGVHLDVVRHFFSASTILKWLDAWALFGFNAFHWHLTDDDGWRVPSKIYPAVSEIGGWRGPDMPLPPQMGTGGRSYGGVYTAAEIDSVVARCEELGMALIPEMDLPGHARALIRSLPELSEPDDASRYRSVQHHSDNVINPIWADTSRIVKSLLDEWMELFPGSIFHIGSDEVPEGAWLDSPAAKKWMAENDCGAEDLHGEFLAEMERHLKKSGRTMAGWEEVLTGQKVSRECWVYSWQGLKAGMEAMNAGHPVVMTPAQSCYFDLAVTENSDDPGYYWAGCLPLEAVYNYQPTKGVTEDQRSLFKGVQYCLWTELIESDSDAEFMLFPRLLAGAEVAFEVNESDQFESFLRRVRHWAPYLNRLGLAVRSETQGW